jgi:hypothetical protein
MRRIVGLSLLFSGAALFTHIVAGVSLPAALAVGGVFPVVAFATAWRRLTPIARAVLLQQLKVGLLAGVIATGAYDVTKFVLSQLDPSPYSPFEVIRIFGLLIAGPSVSLPARYLVGAVFHLFNGICFGVAYWLLLGRFGIWAAVVWGLFLEVFQLTLYPGWLDVRFYREFVQISALSHLIYGVVLGISCRWLQRRFT